MAIYTNYNYDYSSLFGNTSSVSSQYNLLYSAQQAKSASKLSYGKNNVSGLLSTQAQQYLTSIKSSSNDLVGILSSLTGKGSKTGSVFDTKTAVSSNSDLMSVSYDAAKAGAGAFEQKSIQISQLAEKQKNTGTAVSASAHSFDSKQYYQFEVEIGGKKSQFSFSALSTDSNSDVMKKAADAINKKNIGITASVSVDSKTNKASLIFESKETGAENAFTVKDIYGDAMDKLGMNSNVTEAKDAIYSINGETKTSKSNTVDLGNGVTGTFKKTSADNVNVSWSSNGTSGINKAREMVNAFNQLLESSDDNRTADRGANRLFTALKGTSKTYSRSLEKVGISVSSDGYLSIDADKMNKAAESGDLKKLFSDSSGFASALSKTASSVDRNPSDYLSASAMSGSQNTGNSTLNYLQSVRMSQYNNIGLLFDGLF